MAASRPGSHAVRRTDTEICATIAEAFAESGLTDAELKDFLTEVRDEVRAEKRAPDEQG